MADYRAEHREIHRGLNKDVDSMAGSERYCANDCVRKYVTHQPIRKERQMYVSDLDYENKSLRRRSAHPTSTSNSPRSLPCCSNPPRGSLGTAGLIVLALAFASQLALAVPLFDPFADATASGGTSYAVGSTLTNQFNPALFIPWYSRGGNFGTTTPLIASGSLSYPACPPRRATARRSPRPLSTSACQDLNLPSGGQPAWSSAHTF